MAWVGLDGADEGHQICEYEVQSGRKQHYAVVPSAESLQEWVNQLRIRYEGQRVAPVPTQPRRVALRIESAVIGKNTESALSQRGEE